MEEKKQEKLSYYQRNRERCLATAKAYREEHKEYYQSYWKDYFQANKAELNKKRAEYAKKHKERIYKKNRTEYYPRHKEKKEMKQEKKKNPTELPPVLSDSGVEIPRFSLVMVPGGVVTFD